MGITLRPGDEKMKHLPVLIEARTNEAAIAKAFTTPTPGDFLWIPDQPGATRDLMIRGALLRARLARMAGATVPGYGAVHLGGNFTDDERAKLQTACTSDPDPELEHRMGFEALVRRMGLR